MITLLLQKKTNIWHESYFNVKVVQYRVNTLSNPPGSKTKENNIEIDFFGPSKPKNLSKIFTSWSLQRTSFWNNICFVEVWNYASIREQWFYEKDFLWVEMFFCRAVLFTQLWHILKQPLFPVVGLLFNKQWKLSVRLSRVSTSI